MPSKYSHALVLSHYGSQGLNEPDVRLTKKAGPRSSVISARSTPMRSTQHPTRVDTAQSSRSSPASPQPFSSSRTRLGTSTPYTRIEASPPPLHRRTSSVQTQIFAPPSPPPTRDHQTYTHFENRPHTPRHQPSVETQIYDPQSPRSSQSPTSMTDWSRSSEVKARRRAAQVSSPNRSRLGSRNILWKEPGDKSPEKPQTPPLTHASQENGSSEAQAFHPSRPPSPPATPDSGKSFGLETHLDRLDKKSLHPPAAGSSDTVDLHLEASSDRLENSASRKASAASGHSEASSESLVILPKVPPTSGKSFGLKNHLRISGSSEFTSQVPVLERSVPQSLSNSSKSDQPATSQPPPVQPSTSQSQGSRAYHSPTFSMTTQISSRGSNASNTFDPYPDPINPKKTASLHSPTLSITAPPLPSTREHSRPTTSKSSQGPRFSISTRRSSLNFANAPPPDLARKTSMPTEIFFDHDDDADLESLPSEMDFDSMPWTDLNADPAILCNGDGRASISSRGSSFDSAAPPPIRRAPNYPMFDQKPIPKTPKKTRHSLSSLLFSRAPPPPPKAILYSETMPGPPPISVAVSGKNISSNAAIYQASRSQSQPYPQQQSEERIGRQMSMNDAANSVPYAPPRRGVSQGAASEKRGGWFRNNEADRGFGYGKSVRKKAIDEIVRANLYV